MPTRELLVEIPGRRPLALRHVALDLNGTLAVGGRILPGVAPRLARLARVLPVTVLTADTFGTAAAALRRLPVSFQPVRTGAEKRAFAAAHPGCAAVGNGANDAAMLRRAALGIAVVGPEGAWAPLVAAADVVTTRIEDALDLLLEPRRLAATLRR